MYLMLLCCADIRYVFTMSVAALEIALCVLDTATKFAPRKEVAMEIGNENIVGDTTSMILSQSGLVRECQQPTTTKELYHDDSFSPRCLSLPVTEAHPSTHAKICLSCGPDALLPRVRYVNKAFESCFGHLSSWICGRSITVLCGTLTSTPMLNRLCAMVKRTGDFQTLSNSTSTMPTQHLIALYSAGGAPLHVRVTIYTLPNYSGNPNKDSVAVLDLNTFC